jgi:hypothetical protein
MFASKGKGCQAKIRFIHSRVTAGKPRLHAHHLRSLAEGVPENERAMSDPPMALKLSSWWWSATAQGNGRAAKA